MVAQPTSEQSRTRSTIDTAFGIFFDDYPYPSHVYDRDTFELLAVNKAALRLAGVTKQDYLSKTLVDAWPPENRPEFLAHLEKRRRGEASIADRAGLWQHIRADGVVVTMALLLSQEINVDGRMLTHSIFAEATNAEQFDREILEARCRKYAYSDALTGLPNRSSLQEDMETLFERKAGFAVVLIDLAQLPSVNSSLGHDVGDELIRASARRIAAVLADHSALYRFSSGSFVVLLHDATEMRSARKMARRILERFSEPLSLGGDDVFTHVKLGITIAQTDAADVEALLREAELALQTIDGPEREQFAFFEPELQRRAKKTLTTETLLRKAIDRRDLTVGYQPIVDAKTGEVVSAEALLRWDEGVLGSATVPDVISIAERTGLILTIGEFVLREACAQARRWQLAGLPPIRLCVNVSPRQFAQATFLKLVAEICRMTAFDTKELQIELTESTMMSDAGVARRTLDALRRMNVRVAVDDFGTGYSSLSYLGEFPLDVVKIDRTFVARVTDDRFKAAIAKAIVTLSHGLGMTVVAEGVEHQAQYDALVAMGSDQIQGYFVSKALDGKAFAQFIERRVAAAR